MELSFYKFQGTGNDFILIDNRSHTISLTTGQINFLCDRRFGVGADGLMFLELEPGFDFKMVYFNSDGNQSSMCGNGGRCIVAFAKLLNIIPDKCKFLAIDGAHEGAIIENNNSDSLASNLVSLKMMDVKDIEVNGDHYFLNTGSPHYVTMVSNLESYDVVGEGKKIRYNARFKEEGTNVNFIEKKDDVIFVRTYERGVEDETFSCGTGVTAAALVAGMQGLLNSKNSCLVKTLGGDLEVKFEKVLETNFYNIWLQGPAEMVYEGSIKLKD